MKPSFYLSIVFSIITFVSLAQKTNESQKFEPVKESEKPSSLMKSQVETLQGEASSNKNENANQKESYRRTFANKIENVLIEVKEANGQKKMKLTEFVNGQRRVTQYVGEEVDKKIKELETRFPSSKQ